MLLSFSIPCLPIYQAVHIPPPFGLLGLGRRSSLEFCQSRSRTHMPVRHYRWGLSESDCAAGTTITGDRRLVGTHGIHFQQRWFAKEVNVPREVVRLEVEFPERRQTRKFGRDGTCQVTETHRQLVNVGEVAELGRDSTIHLGGRKLERLQGSHEADLCRNRPGNLIGVNSEVHNILESCHFTR